MVTQSIILGFGYGRPLVFAVHDPPRLDCQNNYRVPNDLDFGCFSNLHRIVCDHDEVS